MLRLRQMLSADADEVRRVDLLAWQDILPAKLRLTPRTRENILACRAVFPAGCLVAETRGRMIGFIFSRRWGTLGWVGTFGVLPEARGAGIGQRLLARAVAALKKSGCREIGLETMETSP
ncbi:MAG: GNAT family N-acetyltransferase, partial [Candidatus Deferrimicrobiota bacterium]